MKSFYTKQLKYWKNVFILVYHNKNHESIKYYFDWFFYQSFDKKSKKSMNCTKVFGSQIKIRFRINFPEPGTFQPPLRILEDLTAHSRRLSSPREESPTDAAIFHNRCRTYSFWSCKFLKIVLIQICFNWMNIECWVTFSIVRSLTCPKVLALTDLRNKCCLLGWLSRQYRRRTFQSSAPHWWQT